MIALVSRPEGIIFRKEEQMETIHWILHGILLLILVSFMRDGLTGLWVRRVYQLFYPLVVKTRGWVVLIDTDGLKTINDRDGHSAGDVALRTVARIVRKHGGLSFRFGGDEFALLLPFVSEAKAEAVAEKICAASKKYTVSIGIGRWEQEADAALYQAKMAGRNCVKKPG